MSLYFYADKDNQIEVDWDFLDLIYENRDLHPHPVPETKRQDFAFDPVKYYDAVVMPWYRNQDQPQVSTCVVDVLNVILNCTCELSSYDITEFQTKLERKVV